MRKIQTAAVTVVMFLGASVCLRSRSEPASPPPRLATIPIPGDAAFVPIARDVLDACMAVDPSIASNAGLFEDAVRAPRFDKAAVRQLSRRLDADLAALRRMPWRSWPVDRQIDFRWMYSNAETLQHLLVEERPWSHRPAAWLEPFANNLIAFASYRPDDLTSRSRIWALVPALVTDMRGSCPDPTIRDRETARKLIAALTTMAERDATAEAKAAAASLAVYDGELAALQPKREFQVVGREAYAWRFRHALLLDRTPDQLLDFAKLELARVDEGIAAAKEKTKDAPPAEATADQKARAASMTRESKLALYDAVEEGLRAATIAGGFVTIPFGVGPIRARETPEAMIPLSGDGGSMNPPPPFLDFDIGYWNVEHFKPDVPLEDRLKTVVTTDNWRKNGFGTYAAHEGMPGHHLQLAIARLHVNALRNVLQDNPLCEGWALYAEEELWRHGGMDDGPEARSAVLRSYRGRIMRVFYEVNIENGAWNLQQAADFKHGTEPGKSAVDEELLRSIQWPTQLISYFTGKNQLLELKEAYRRKLGTAYSDRAFNDAVLAEGSIPIALIRASLLGEPVPGL